MAHAIGSAWSEFGHVRFVIGHSPLAIGRNLYRAAWLGRNGHVRFAIGHSPLAIGHIPHSAACPGRNKRHVRISRQSARFGPFPALCGANAANVCALVCIDCAAGRIHAHNTHNHHQHMRTRAHAHSEHIDMHLAIKSNQMHYA
jgi:hypothetical protein